MTASRTIGPRRGPLLLAVVAIWAIGLVLAPAAALFERSLRSIDPASLEISVELDRLHDDLAATRWDWERTPDAEARADLDRRMRLLADRAGRLAGQETPPRVVHDLSTHARGLAAEARALPRTLGLAVSVAVVATLLAYPPAWCVLGAGRRGFGLVLCPGYPSLVTDFEAVARALAARLRAWLPPDAPLCFLGHSLGGLLARRLMAEADIGSRSLACVTLGAPHGGSSLAALAFGRLGRGLVPGGPVCRIVAALPDPSDVALLSLASPVDAMVTPLAGLAVGRPGWREEATPAVSHLGMLWHPAVIARAVSFLAEAADKRPV